MANEKPLGFTLELFDKMSGPAGGMAKSIDEVTRKLEESVKASIGAQGGLDAVGEAAKRQAQIHRMVVKQMQGRADAAFKQQVGAAIDKGLGKESPLVKINTDLGELKSKAGGMGVDWLHLGGAVFAGQALAGAFSFGVLPAAQAILGVVGKIGDGLGSAVGFAMDLVKGAIKKEKGALSMDLLLGKEDAAHLSAYINQIGGKTAFLRGELKGAAKQLVVAGFNVAQIPEAMAAAQDMAAISGEGLENSVAALERVRLTGKFDARVLRAMKIEEKGAMGNLARILGVTPEQAEKAMSSGKVAVDNVLAALYQSISAKTRGPLGQAGVAAGNTVDALLYKLSHLPETYMAALSGSVGKSEAFDSFRTVLQRLNDLLDPSSAIGEKFIAKIGKVLTWLTDFLVGDALKEGPDAISGLERVLNSFADSLDLIVPYVQIAAATLKDLFKVLASAADSGGVVGNLLSYFGAIGKMQAGADNAASKARQNGANISKGLADGIKSGAKGVEDAILGVSRIPEEVTRQETETHSPSKVFERLGMALSEGYAIGIKRGSGVSEAVADMSRPPRMGASHASSVSMGDIVINIQGGNASAQEIGAEVEGRLRSAFPSLLCQTLEILQTEAGSSSVTG